MQFNSDARLEALSGYRLTVGVAASGQPEIVVTADNVAVSPGVDLTLPTRGADPRTGALGDGETTIYVSDGSADVTGADGDVVVTVNNGGTIKTKIIADYSAL